MGQVVRTWAGPIVATSSNPTLLPERNIQVTCDAARCTLRLTPVAGEGGEAVVRLFVDTPSGLVRLVPRWDEPATNPPPVLVAPDQLRVLAMGETVVTGLRVQADDSETVALQLSVEAGQLRLRLDAPGGIGASQVDGNGSSRVSVEAPVLALNATLASPEGLVYTAPAASVGGAGDILTVEVRRAGATGLTPKSAVTAHVLLLYPADPLADWRGRFFSAADLADPAKEASVWGDRADPDRDGRDNLMEFALGLQPNVPERSPEALSAQVVEQAGKKYPCLTFLRRKNEPGIIYVPEVSSDGQTWSSADQRVRPTRVEDLGNGFERVTYQDLVEVTPGHPRYFRLRVIKTGP